MAHAGEVTTIVRITDNVIADDLPRGEMKSPISVSVDAYLESKYRIKRGFVCQSDRDILCINDICGDENHYWAIVLNNNEQNTSLNSMIKQGDVLEMVYRCRMDQSHESLRRWASSLTEK